MKACSSSRLRSAQPPCRDMSRAAFIAEFSALGFAIEEKGDFILFTFTVPVGKFAGRELKLGFQITGDMPVNPPAGPHVSPALLPFNSNADPHPKGGVHASSLGAEWQYWSRPFKSWREGERTARRYMAHITNLFITQ
jgi:hypothetical protein